MVEHLFCKQRVIGSIPVTSTIGLGKLKYVEYFRQPERIERQPESTFRQPERQAERVIETIYFNLRKLSNNAEIFNKLESRNQQTMKAVI